MKQSLAHYPQHNAAGVNTSTTVPMIILAFDVMHVLQDITVRQGKKCLFTRQAIIIYIMIIYLVHRDYQVVKAMLLHAPAPVLYYAPPEVVNRHLVMDVIPVQQVHTKMERC